MIKEILNKEWLVFCLLVLISTSISFSLRSQLDLIFNETEMILQVKEQVKESQSISATDYWRHNFKNIWTLPEDNHQQRLTGSYRPLQELLVLFYILNFAVFSSNVHIPILINSLFLGLMGGMLYILGLKLTQRKFSSIIMAALTMFSVPSLAGTWIVFPGSHPLVVLIVSLSIYLHLIYKEKRQNFLLIFLGIILFFAPLYKEYLCVLPIMIFLMEAIDKSRKRFYIGFLCFFIFHALFPATIIYAMYFKKLILFSPILFARAYVQPEIKWVAINHLVFLVPPSLSLLAMFAMYHLFKDHFNRNRLLIFVSSLIFLSYLTLFYPFGCPSTWTTITGAVIFMSFICFFAARIHPALFVWLTISLAPLLLRFYIELHLLYCLAPFILTLIVCIEDWLKKLKIYRKALAMIVYISIYLLLFDQCLNILSSYRIFRATNISAQSVAKEIAKQNPGKDPVLISSTLLGKDVKYYLAENEEILLSMNGFSTYKMDPISEEQNFTNPRKLQAYLDHTKNKNTVFILDVDAYRSRIYQLKNSSRYKVHQIYQHVVDISYPYLDPLKYFIPFEYISYPGSPDLNDFALVENKFFKRTVKGNQILYKIQ